MNTARFPAFVDALAKVIERETREAAVVAQASALLANLVSHDDWLPEAFAAPDPEHYRQYRLHADPKGRFSLVSFVWGPGQATPIHDHTVWGLVGMLRGAELSQAYSLSGGRLQPEGPVRRLRPGEVEAVSPTIGDIHRVTNAFDDQVSISIHVYGADIGTVRRHTYDAAGRTKTFVSGYSKPSPARTSA